MVAAMVAVEPSAANYIRRLAATVRAPAAGKVVARRQHWTGRQYLTKVR
jgi:hypothetical protein